MNPLLCDPETGFCELPGLPTDQKLTNVEQKNENRIQVIYYTDPICSSCWGIEPQLRRMKLEYGHVLDIKYKMGGLLPDWSYNSGGISKPEDVAHHWDEVSRHYQMPIDGNVWLEDPLDSSYPPSIAVKAAQMQDQTKAVKFLRRIREMLFLEKRNITKLEYLTSAAKDTGLDVQQLKDDYTNGHAEKRFQVDLELRQRWKVRGFPSFFFTDKDGNSEFVSGSKPYTSFEQAILNLLPGVQKRYYDKSWENLFKQFSSLTVREFSELSGIGISAGEMILDNLAEKKLLRKDFSRNGNIYRRMDLSCV